MLAAVVLVGNALVGERGLIAMIRAAEESASLAQAIEVLRAENNGLREDVRRLREEPRAIEELARGQLGLIHPGEKLLIVTPSGPWNPVAARPNLPSRSTHTPSR